MQYHSDLCKIFWTPVYKIYENFYEKRNSIFIESFYESKKPQWFD